MRRSIELTVQRISSGDLFIGFLATCLCLAILFGLETAVMTRTMSLEAGIFHVLAAPLAPLVSVLALVGIYIRVGRDEADSGAKTTTNGSTSIPDSRLHQTARLTATTLKRCGSTLLAGVGVAIVASLLVAILLLAVVLTVLTIAGYASYAFGDGQLISAVRIFHRRSMRPSGGDTIPASNSLLS